MRLGTSGDDPGGRDNAARLQREIDALHATTVALSAPLDTDALLELIVERAATLVGGAHGYVYVRSDDGTRMVERIAQGPLSPWAGSEITPDEGNAGLVWRTGKAQIDNDYRAYRAEARHRRGDPRRRPRRPAQGARRGGGRARARTHRAGRRRSRSRTSGSWSGSPRSRPWRSSGSASMPISSVSWSSDAAPRRSCCTRSHASPTPSSRSSSRTRRRCDAWRAPPSSATARRAGTSNG